MSTDRDKCSLTSLLPMSCRDRAESFARRLHSRLTSLGSQDAADEASWLAAPPTVAVTQPRSDADIFLDLGLLDSPGSPQEDVVVVNKNGSADSDSSECTFYDLESDSERVNGVNGCEEESETFCSQLTVEKDLTVECCEYVSEVSLEPRTALTEDEEDLEPTPRVRRCSSLKTGKTPPGTPGHKKIVRFADVLGLDLADVRTFLDEIPKVPTSAYEDLTDVDFSEPPDAPFYPSAPRHPDKLLVVLFQQPGGEADFLDRVRANLVCLENAVVSDPVSLAVSGTVRVRNLDFHKSVHVRYSLDGWRSFADLQAVYVANSCDGFSDKFSFLLYANNLGIGQRLEFAVRFSCKGGQYWDNNEGANYCFQCLPSSNMTYFPPSEWQASFY